MRPRNLLHLAGQRSITGRLTLIYALAAFGLLTCSTVSLYLSLVESVEQTNDAVMGDEVDLLNGALQEAGRIEAFNDELQEANARHHARFQVRLLMDGRIRAESPGMGQLLPLEIFSQFEGTGGGAETVTDPRGRPWRIETEKLDYPGGTRKTAVLQLGLDVSRETALIDRYRRNMIAALIGGGLLSAAAGALTARRGMRPLAEITAAAHRITVSHLHERIGLTPWPEELTTLAQAFDGMLVRLEGSFAHLSQFSADLAHELRTPINNLMGEAEVCLSRPRSLAEYRQTLESATEEYSRLARMIDSLLFLARAEAADRVVDRVVLRAENEAEVVRAFFEGLAEEKGVTVTCSGSASVYADSILLRRAVSNLLANALQYTARGGQISVTLGENSRGDTEIEVSDSGVGIEAEDLPRIFDRFFRADRARTRYGEGSGLGLALVRSIMDLHGGDIRVASELGKGSRFTLVFRKRLKA